MRRAIILLCLILCLLAFWLMSTALERKEMKEPDSRPQVSSTVSTSVSAPTPLKVEKAPTARKPLKISSKGKVRLKPGESAVLGYWEIAPGMNGMAIVTPETTPDGFVKMRAMLLNLSDEAVTNTDVQDLFPDIFDFENYSAVTPDRLSELQQALHNTGGVDRLSMPAVLSRPGEPASISIGPSNQSMLSLGLQADPVPGEGGFDLSLELQREEP